jgi:SAM-dependent methyltransferase
LTSEPKAKPLPNCKVCGGTTIAFGEKSGRAAAHPYRFSRCEVCNFISVVNPCLDFARLYNDDYYRGKGADPTVDYLFELEHVEETIRRYEWRGIQRLIEHLNGDLSGIRWLDYGCGNGALVRYLRRQKIDAVGFDEGAIVSLALAKGIPILTEAELEREVGRCSVVTMIEVIEHVPDPMPVLRNVRRFLKSGGLLFLTTGNSAPYRKRFADWRYVMPDVHVSYFDPHNMAIALATSGFECTFPGYVSGWEDIIRFKVLKSLGWRKVGVLEQLVPWSLASPFIDSQVRSSGHPVGRAI